MTVYIEYVIIDNFVIDFLLLKATFALTNSKTSKLRLLFCALLGVGLALVFPLITTNAVISVLFRIFTCPLLVFLSCKDKRIKVLFFNCCVFLGYTFLCGGAVYGILSLFNVGVSEVFIAVCFVPVWAVLFLLTKVVKFIYKRKTVIKNTFTVKVKINGKTVSATGFMDTGNNLYDKDTPVIVCDKKFFTECLGEFSTLKSAHYITASTVNGSKNLLGVKLESLTVIFLEGERIFNNITLACSGEWTSVDYDIILHPALLEKDYVEKIEGKTFKVS